MTTSANSITYRHKKVNFKFWKEVTPLIGVTIKDDESFEKALRRFNKFCEKTGIISDIKKHQHFEKPSASKKRKLAAAKRKARRAAFLENKNNN